ncbi:MAG: hypothetical protein UT02_C0043G0005 [Parcubacteria group bacterium GW2011_GWC2_38_7]|nr:MAG: hypothetical protein UT02_C0043G0005 [Parcubacteria group bacterium GW2011_GWC2_38_7]
MFEEQWTKIFSLVKKTGDKVIVFNEKENDSLVVMPLSQYEELVYQQKQVIGLTEDEMLDRINQDIAQWQASQPEINLEENVEKKDDLEKGEEEEERYYVEPLE